MEESLQQQQQEESESLSQPPAEAAKPHSHKRVIKLLREMWPAYLIEVLVIILGISITLALENWRDRAKEKEQAGIYLENLISDVEADKENLQNTIAATQTILRDGRSALAAISSVSASTPDSTFYRYLIRLLGRPKFLVREGTFTDLKSSGNIAVIHDFKLRNAIFRYYSICDAIHENQDAEQQTTITISGPYFLKAIPVGDSLVAGGQRSLPAGLRQDPQLRGNILLRVSNREELLALYQEAQNAQTALLNLVKTSVPE